MAIVNILAINSTIYKNTFRNFFMVIYDSKGKIL